MKYKILPWYIKIFGFYYRFRMQVLNIVQDESGNFIYTIKVIGNELWWFGIKLKTYDNPELGSGTEAEDDTVRCLEAQADS